MYSAKPPQTPAIIREERERRSWRGLGMSPRGPENGPPKSTARPPATHPGTKTPRGGEPVPATPAPIHLARASKPAGQCHISRRRGHRPRRQVRGLVTTRGHIPWCAFFRLAREKFADRRLVQPLAPHQPVHLIGAEGLVAEQ